MDQPRLQLSTQISADVTRVAFLPAGELVCVTGDEQLVCYTQLGEQTQLPVDISRLGPVRDVAVDHKAGRLAVLCEHGYSSKVHVYTLDGRRPPVHYQADGAPRAVTVTPDGSILLATGNFGLAFITRFSGGGTVWKRRVEHGCEHLVVQDDGSVVSSGADGIHVYSDDLQLIYTIQGGDRITEPCSVCTGAGDTLYTVDRGRKTLCVCDNQGENIRDILTDLHVTPDTEISVAIYRQNLIALCTEDTVSLYNMDIKQNT